MHHPNVLADLQTQVQHLIETVETEFLPLEPAALNWKPAPDAWSILECFEHLNRYNRYYNAELENAMEKGRTGKASAFRPGWLGDYFVRTMSPENTKPVKTMKHLNPTGSQLSVSTLHEFLEHQRHLLRLLVRARGANLNRRAVRVEILPLLRIKTGDGLRFVVAHERRHMAQALRVRQMEMKAMTVDR